jgi:hypothetical protein
MAAEDGASQLSAADNAAGMSSVERVDVLSKEDFKIAAASSDRGGDDSRKESEKTIVHNSNREADCPVAGGRRCRHPQQHLHHRGAGARSEKPETDDQVRKRHISMIHWHRVVNKLS